MNAKYALALILALQVSMSLCEAPAPSAELLEKYNTIKATFLGRLLKGYSKLKEVIVPMPEREVDDAHPINYFYQGLPTNPELQAIVKVATDLRQQANPLVENTRKKLLGLYEKHVRPQFGEALSKIIDIIKIVLDKFMPAE